MQAAAGCSRATIVKISRRPKEAAWERQAGKSVINGRSDECSLSNWLTARPPARGRFFVILTLWNDHRPVQLLGARPPRAHAKRDGLGFHDGSGPLRRNDGHSEARHDRRRRTIRDFGWSKQA